MTFDYKRETFWNHRFNRNTYLAEETQQRSAFMIGSESGDNKYEVNLEVTGKFTTATKFTQKWNTGYYKGVGSDRTTYKYETH